MDNDLDALHGSYNGPFGLSSCPRRQERAVRDALAKLGPRATLDLGDGNTDPDHPSVQLPPEVAKRLCQARRP